MRKIAFFIIFFILAVMQASFLDQASIFGVSPDLILLSLLFLVFFSENYALVMSGAFFLGLLMDIFSGFYFGSYVLSFFILGNVIYLILNKLIPRGNNYIFLAIVFIGTILESLIIFCIVYLIYTFNADDYYIHMDLLFFKNIMLESAYNAILAFILLPLKKFFV